MSEKLDEVKQIVQIDMQKTIEKYNRTIEIEKYNIIVIYIYIYRYFSMDGRKRCENKEKLVKGAGSCLSACSIHKKLIKL
jgi:hypothetical protein